MTSPIRPFRLLPRLINGIQQRMMSSARPPLTPERIKKLRKLVEKAIERAEQELKEDPAKYVSEKLSPYDRFKLEEADRAKALKDNSPDQADK